MVIVTLGLAGLLLDPGCASDVISSRPDTKPNIESGIIYSLPKQMVLIKVVREKTDVQKMFEKLGKQQAAKDEADKAVETAQQKVDAIKGQLDQTPAEDKPSTEKFTNLLALAKISLAAAKITADSALVDLEEIKLALQQVKDAKFTDTITTTLQPAIPDPEWTFVAEPRHSTWREDTVSLKTSAEGLLEGYVGTANDKTGEVLLKTIEVLRFAKAAIGGTKTLMNVDLGSVEKKEPKPFKYERVIDPTDPSDILAVNKDLNDRQAHYYFTVANANGNPASAPPKPTNPRSGLYYRRSLFYTLMVYDLGEYLASSESKKLTDEIAKTNGIYVQSLPMLLPNQGPVAVIELPASRMVSTDYDFAFKDGMLISFKTKRPSEVLAGATLLPDILHAIVSIPTDLIQLKIDYSTKDKALADAKKAQLDSQLALYKTEKDYKAATSSDTAATGTSEPAK